MFNVNFDWLNRKLAGWVYLMLNFDWYNKKLEG